MTAIKFGTDGWCAIIAKEFTVDNVERVSEATAKWMLKRKMTKAVVGYDSRFGGQMFSEVTAKVLGDHGIKVYLSPGFISTPMVSLAVVKTGSDMGVVITASHNPPSYNGYNLKSAYGGPAFTSVMEEVEAIVPESAISNLPSLQELEEQGLLDYLDMEAMYIDHVEQSFDLEAIKKSGFKLAYDGMYGTGQNVIRRLFPEAFMLHCDYNPSFKGKTPEPILVNLPELSEIMHNDPSLNLGLANDGDAERIGLFDEDGNFLDASHILLLVLYYLFEYKKEIGKLFIPNTTTEKVKKLADIYGLECEIAKSGIINMAEIMTREDVLIGAEESGGLMVKGHIPESDGIWVGLMLLEFMAKTGKSIKQLAHEVDDKLANISI